MTSSTSTSSYIPIDKLTSSTFNAYTYANDLVRSVNTASASASNATDALVDLATPLQKTLFDVQEIDTSIHNLTSRNALQIIEYTATQNQVAQRILERVEEERKRLVDDFDRVRKEVLGRYERAERARVGAERSLKVGKLLRGVQRVVGLGRAFETVLADSGLGTVSGSAREKHGELVGAARVVLEFREVMGRPDAAELGKVQIVKVVRGRVFEDGEARLLDWARKVVREFSVSSLVSTPSVSVGGTYKEAEDAKARFTSAVHVLYLLSPAPKVDGRRMRKDEFEAEYLIRALQGYLQSAVTSSAAGLGRGLREFPQLDRALLEVSARCQNVIAFERLLSGIPPPEHAWLPAKEEEKTKSKTKQDEQDVEELDEEMDELELGVEEDAEGNLLEPLLTSLDTASLASFFWRSLASQMSSKVHEILNRGGVSARTLKSNRDLVRAEIKECVLRGSKMPSTLTGRGSTFKEEVVGNWEREAAVMVGAIVGQLIR